MYRYLTSNLVLENLQLTFFFCFVLVLLLPLFPCTEVSLNFLGFNSEIIL